MAGSYGHLTTSTGKFRGIELIENLGDAHEALEECYGMIQVLAGGDPALIRSAQLSYRDGLYGNVVDSARWSSSTDYGPPVPDGDGDES